MVVRVRQRKGERGGRGPRAPRVVDSLAAVAEFAGVTLPSASAWFERGAPVMPDGRYDLWEIARWYATAHASPDTEADGVSKSQWEARRVRATALEAEQRLAVSQGTVMPRAEHDRFVHELVDSFVSSLEIFPHRVAPLLVAARGYEEINQILEDHIRWMRIQLAAKHAAPEAADDAGAGGG